MKKNVKKILSLVSAGAMIMSASANVFADEVVVSDDFEIHSGVDSNVLVSMPEVKVYGDEIVVDGNFESNDDIGRYSGHALSYSVNSVGSGSQYLKKSTAKSNNGSKSLCIDPNSAYLSNNYLTINLKQSVDQRYKLTTGIYEAEIWVYTDAPNYAVGFGPHYRAASEFATNGCITAKAQLQSGEWTKLRATLSVVKEETENDIVLQVPIYSGWTALPDNASKYYPLYFDDFSLRKIENAQPKNQADEGEVMHTNQVGIPLYTNEGIRGTAEEPKTVNVSCNVSNTSEDDTTATLISALYNADGSLYSILSMTDEMERDIYAGESKELVNTFEIPATAPSDCKLVNYLWDGFDTAQPHMASFEYPSYSYKILGSVYHQGKNIPNSTWKSVPAYTDYSSFAHKPTYFDQLMPGVSRNGMSSLYLPLTKTYSRDDGNRGWAYRDFEAKAGHTYKVEFYAFDNASDYLAFEVHPSEGLHGIKNDALKSTVDVENSDFKSFQPTTASGGNIRVYEGYNKGWGKLTFTFTATTDGTHSVMLSQGNNGYLDKGDSHKAQGVYIDDFKITDTTNTAAVVTE